MISEGLFLCEGCFSEFTSFLTPERSNEFQNLFLAKTFILTQIYNLDVQTSKTFKYLPYSFFE